MGRIGWMGGRRPAVPALPALLPFVWLELCSCFAGGLMKLIGIALIVLGVLALAAGGFSYTTREKVLDLGPIQATTEKHKTIPLSPLVGIAAVVGGIAVLAAGSRTGV